MRARRDPSGGAMRQNPDDPQWQRAEDQHRAQQVHGAEEEVAEAAHRRQQRRRGADRSETDVAVAAHPLVEQRRTGAPGTRRSRRWRGCRR